MSNRARGRGVNEDDEEDGARGNQEVTSHSGGNDAETRANQAGTGEGCRTRPIHAEQALGVAHAVGNDQDGV